MARACFNLTDYPTKEKDVTRCRSSKEEKKEEEIGRATLIWRAAKLPMYTVALISLTVGTAAAYLESGNFSLERYFILLVSFVLVNVWINLSNDVYDFDTGADKNKKESVVNIFGSCNAIHILSWWLLALGFTGLCWVGVEANTPRYTIIVFGNLLRLYLPVSTVSFELPWAGRALMLCSIWPVLHRRFYLLQSGSRELPISSTIVSAAILVGFTSALILFCSHFHQIEDDKAVGKISPLVRLGTEKGSKVVRIAVLGLYWLVFGFGLAQTLPYSCIVLCSMTLPMGNSVVSFVQKNHEDNSKIFMAKYYCVRLHTVFGAALAAGLVVSRMHSGQQIQSLWTYFDRAKFVCF